MGISTTMYCRWRSHHRPTHLYLHSRLLLWETVKPNQPVVLQGTIGETINTTNRHQQPIYCTRHQFETTQYKQQSIPLFFWHNSYFFIFTTLTDLFTTMLYTQSRQFLKWKDECCLSRSSKVASTKTTILKCRLESCNTDMTDSNNTHFNLTYRLDSRENCANLSIIVSTFQPHFAQTDHVHDITNRYRVCHCAILTTQYWLLCQIVPWCVHGLNVTTLRWNQDGINLAFLNYEKPWPCNCLSDCIVYLKCEVFYFSRWKRHFHSVNRFGLYQLRRIFLTKSQKKPKMKIIHFFKLTFHYFVILPATTQPNRFTFTSGRDR